MSLKNRTNTYTVLTTAAFSRIGLVGGRATTMPGSQAHAKTTGTITTLCGQSALTWFKFWEIPFTAVRDDRCPRCAIAFEKLLITEDGN